MPLGSHFFFFKCFVEILSTFELFFLLFSAEHREPNKYQKGWKIQYKTQGKFLLIQTKVSQRKPTYIGNFVSCCLNLMFLPSWQARLIFTYPSRGMVINIFFYYREKTLKLLLFSHRFLHLLVYNFFGGFLNLCFFLISTSSFLVCTLQYAVLLACCTCWLWLGGLCPEAKMGLLQAERDNQNCTSERLRQFFLF